MRYIACVFEAFVRARARPCHDQGDRGRRQTRGLQQGKRTMSEGDKTGSRKRNSVTLMTGRGAAFRVDDQGARPRDDDTGTLQITYVSLDNDYSSCFNKHTNDSLVSLYLFLSKHNELRLLRISNK